VPASVDPNALAFGSGGPLGPPSHQPLFDQFQTPSVSGQTANADPPGRPGFIINLPAFNYEVFPPGFISPGDYNIGVACIGPQGQLDKFYNVVDTARATGFGNADLKSLLVGSTSAICSGPAQTTVNRFGFLSIATCGSTALTGPLVA